MDEQRDKQHRSVQNENVMDIGAVSKSVEQLLSKASEVLGDGDQPIYVLPEEAVKEVLDNLHTKLPEVFVQTSTWSKPTPLPEQLSDELLEDMGKQLQSGVLAEEPNLVDQVQCEYGDQVYVLPDKTAVQEFIANLAGSDAGTFQQTQSWSKQPAGLSNTKQEALLTDIASRLQSIEAVLLRLETWFQTMNMNR